MQPANGLYAASKSRVRNSLTLLLGVCLAVPAIGSAQTVIAPTPLPDTASPVRPLRLFKNATIESSGGWIGSIKSPNWWEAPASGSEVPKWAIGRSVAFNTSGGLAVSAGFFGRRGDPLPLYLSEGTKQHAARNSGRGPGSYRVQWDAKFGVNAPLWSGPRLKINAIGELFVPLTRSPDPADAAATLLTSRTLRFGIVTAF